MSESRPTPNADDAQADAGRRELTYVSYLELEQLLSLQHPRSAPEHPDELLFIVVHQSSELWFKVILHELEMLVERMDADDALGALAQVKRVNTLTGIVTDQLSALETLPPQHFAKFRGYLGTSSGSQSYQFRAIEAASGLRDAHFMHALEEHGEIPAAVRRALERPTLQATFEGMLARRGIAIEAVYRDEENRDLELLAEGLLEYEQSFSLWRFLHVQLVERIIGPSTGGTGGTLGARYLQRTVNQRFFPNLWAVRGAFFAPGAGSGAGGHAGGGGGAR